MKKILLFVIFLLLCYAIGHAQTYRISYVMTDDAEDFSTKFDKAEKVEAMPSINTGTDDITIEYHGTTYFFRIAELHIIHSTGSSSRYGYHPVWHYSGTAVCMGKPYSIRKTETHSHTTLWIIPMKFSDAHQIHRLRAFVYTNNLITIKEMQNDKAH